MKLPQDGNTPSPIFTTLNQLKTAYWPATAYLSSRLVNHKATKASFYLAGGIAGLWFTAVRPKQASLQALTEKADGLYQDTTQVLETSIMFKPLDKLYLIHNVPYFELEAHRELAMKITQRSFTFNDLSAERKGFEWLKGMKNWYILHYFIDHDWIHTQLQHIDDRLLATYGLLRYADRFNWGQYYFKHRQYTKAKAVAEQVLEVAKNNPQLALPNWSQSHLLAHTYNLAAKVSRAQEDYDQSDTYYEQAKALAPKDPYIRCSQIALWGDYVWNRKQTDKLERFLKDAQQMQEVIADCQAQRYGLGLANLSWVFYQAAQTDHFSKLKLVGQTRPSLLKQAINLSEQAVEYEKALPAKDVSINPWLHMGMAKMALAELVPNQANPLLWAALNDFQEGRQHDVDHPSLLRRTALSLKQLNDLDAYAAYQALLIELNYRLNQGERITNYVAWQKEAESKIKELSSSALKPAQDSETLKFLLIKGDYQAAYKQGQILTTSADQQQWEAWFQRHFTIINGHLTPKLRLNLLLNLVLNQVPTPRELIDLSSVTYLAKHKVDLLPPTGWEPVCYSNQVDPNSEVTTGYLGIAFQNYDTKQIVISHGGTDFSDLADLQTDLQLGLGWRHQQLAVAEGFTQHVLAKYAPKPQGTNPAYIYHTGHSLGGAIAAFMACLGDKETQWQHYAVGFDNPSCWWPLDEAYFHKLAKGLLPADYRDFPVTAFLNRPSFINCAGGQHLGRVMKITVSTDKPQPAQAVLQQQLLQKAGEWLVFCAEEYKKYVEAHIGIPLPIDINGLKNAVVQWKQWLSEDIACHDKELIQAVFGYTPVDLYRNAKQTYYVTDWPKDLGAWKEFKERFKAFAPQGNANVLTYVPSNNPTFQSYYQLQTAFDESGKEIIPLATLETGIRDLLLAMLSQDKPVLNADQEILRRYIHPDLCQHWIKLDANKTHLQVQGPLNSWELLAYLRHCVCEACENEGLSYQKILYPRLSELPKLTRPDFATFFKPAAPALPPTDNSNAPGPKTKGP